jgi:hypothetical protein
MADVIYTWNNIAPNSTVSLFIHGYLETEAVNYTLVVYLASSDNREFPEAHATLAQGETFRWLVNNSQGRKIYITNNMQFHQVTAQILEMVEST